MYLGHIIPVHSSCICMFSPWKYILHFDAFHCLEALFMSALTLLVLSSLHWSPIKEDMHWSSKAQKKNVNSIEIKCSCSLLLLPPAQLLLDHLHPNSVLFLAKSILLVLVGPTQLLCTIWDLGLGIRVS